MPDIQMDTVISAGWNHSLYRDIRAKNVLLYTGATEQ
jgi:hypothetical protein